MSEAKLVEYLLKKGYIKLPTKIFQQQYIVELNKALSTGNPIIFSKFLEKSAEKVDEYLDMKNIENLIEMLKNIEHNIGSQKYSISPDDEKILKFLVSISRVPAEDFLEIAGPLYFITEVLNDIEKNKKILPESILMSTLLWIFVNTYELILHIVDRKLYRYLKSNKKHDNNRSVKYFLKIKRKGKNHATAGTINKVLHVIIGIPQENDSIFGSGSGKPKLLRNKISHSNIFYDSGSKKIVVLDGTEYEMSEFIEQYYQIFIFLLKWIELSIGYDILQLSITLKYEFKKVFKSYAKTFLKIERSGELKRRFYEIVIEWKREAELYS